MWGNMKDAHEEDVAEWVETNEVSDYHTFTIPYGPKYHARKIEKLLYTKDLLLNAEWNRKKDRETTLHRHPAFFGHAIDVMGDCCGYCPKPETPDEEEIAAEESKIYVSGTLSFIKDDPGRQAIGSFHPLTDDDWTDMAYVGNTARLCRAIVDRDLEHVQDWLSQDGADPNQRDYTGRTPLHLAVMTSTPQIVQALIDAGARLVARLFDGKTALHLAAMRGETEMARALLLKSEANEEREAEKEALKLQECKNFENGDHVAVANSKEESEDYDEMECSDEESENKDAMTEGSFVKITRQEPPSHETLPEESDDEPDVYDINVLAWDTPVTALHLAIANGHVDIVKLLVQDFDADVLLPIKLIDVCTRSPRAAILPLVLALHLPPEKAKEMTKLLIDLGASPAQGDVNHTTALNYFASYGGDLLRTIISSNRPAAERVANHLSRGHRSYSSDVKSPLHMAIRSGDIEAVEALLELGTKPEVDFDTYIASIKHQGHMSGHPGYNQHFFKENFEQPVFSAVFLDMPSAVRMLVDAGADVNCLSQNAWQVIRRSSIWKKDIGTLQDVIRNRIRDLHTFMAIGKVEGMGGYTYKRLPPFTLEDDTQYLRGCESGTYTHFITSKQIERAKESYQHGLKIYEEWLETEKEPNGTAEKKEAIEALIKDFEALECYLVERGAKTLTELRPEVKIPEQISKDHYFWPYRTHSQPWSPDRSFQLPYLTESQREAYFKLFEACWEGNLSIIKELTLAVWGNNETPLRIAVQDPYGFSPLSIAVLRKHYSVAKAILEIVHAQYTPEQTPLTRYTIQPTGDDDSSVCKSSDEISIFAEIVDDRFTIENIGEVQAQVQSNVKPLQMIQWRCPMSEFIENDRTSTPDPVNLVQLAMYWDDPNLLEFLIAKCKQYTQATSSTSDESNPKFFNFPEIDFLYALCLGRIQLLELVIKQTGAGFPLNDLVEENGFEISVKPKYYQGLSIHGKKRADWANAGRQTQSKIPDIQHPPLLYAAYFGSLQSFDWFSGDAPLRCYLQFADDHRDDIRIQNLAKAKGGLEASITKWLDLHSHLQLHCVVLGQSDNSLLLLRHLCRNRPEALEKRSQNGMTPLHLAFALHRVEMVKVLLEAGADQTTRNNNGDNIIHSVLEDFASGKHNSKIRELLGLIDARLLPSLFIERTRNAPGAATPLTRWIFANVQTWGNNSVKKEYEDMVRLLLEFSKGEDLGIINGDGDTPVHAVVRYHADTLLQIMLNHRPEILFYENASGRTPFEIAEDSYLSEEIFLSDPPSLPSFAGTRRRIRPSAPVYMHGNASGILERDPASFTKEAGDGRSNIEKVLQVCKNFAGYQGKSQQRRLVSLSEANEVAKRLAGRKTKSSDAGSDADGEEDEEEEKEKDEAYSGSDEVKAWFHFGLR